MIIITGVSVLIILLLIVFAFIWGIYKELTSGKETKRERIPIDFITATGSDSFYLFYLTKDNEIRQKFCSNRNSRLFADAKDQMYADFIYYDKNSYPSCFEIHFCSLKQLEDIIKQACLK
jgi:hypothetical protein